MSEAHCSTDDTAHAAAYESGHSAGLTAISEMQRVAPLEAHQKVWLLGFLQGAIDAAGQPASQTTRVAYAVPSRPDEDSAPDCTASLRHQARIAEIDNHGNEQTGWRGVAFEVDERRLRYPPGSSLALWPTNDPEEVRRILRTLGVSAQLLVPSDNDSEPAWRVLLERVDISTISTPTLRLLAEYCRSSSEAASLAAFADSPSEKSRSLLALLRRFPSARPPIERLLPSLGSLQPSYVPIASSCLESAEPLLATVHTSGEAPTWGRVSPVLQSKLRVGEWLSISVDAGRFASKLCTDDLEPVIIIADGPYVALARAFAAERRERQAKGRTWVIAAGMQSSQFPFSHSLAAWHRAGSLSRFDIALGVHPPDTLRLLTDLEESLWRWLVDHSRCYLISSRQDLRTEVSNWFTTLLARRYRLDHVAAAQRLLQLSQQQRWVVIPTHAGT